MPASTQMRAPLTLKAAYMMDTVGNKVAQSEIAMIKVKAPNMALAVIDQAIQAFGGAGVTSDPGLARAYASMRTLRLADGPDEVHRRTITKLELKKQAERPGIELQRTKKLPVRAVPGLVPRIRLRSAWIPTRPPIPTRTHAASGRMQAELVRAVCAPAPRRVQLRSGDSCALPSLPRRLSLSSR